MRRVRDLHKLRVRDVLAHCLGVAEGNDLVRGALNSPSVPAICWRQRETYPDEQDSGLFAARELAQTREPALQPAHGALPEARSEHARKRGEERGLRADHRGRGGGAARSGGAWRAGRPPRP
jgi:hypothetical protein